MGTQPQRWAVDGDFRDCLKMCNEKSLWVRKREGAICEFWKALPVEKIHLEPSDPGKAPLGASGIFPA